MKAILLTFGMSLCMGCSSFSGQTSVPKRTVIPVAAGTTRQQAIKSLHIEYESKYPAFFGGILIEVGMANDAEYIVQLYPVTKMSSAATDERKTSKYDEVLHIEKTEASLKRRGTIHHQSLKVPLNNTACAQC